MFGQSLLSGAFGSSILDPGLNFDTKLYTGNGSDLSIGGKINGDASFNGSTSNINLGSGGIQATSAVAVSWSISFWMNTSSTGAGTIMNTYGAGGTTYGFTIEVNSSTTGRLRLWSAYGTQYIDEGTTVVNDGKWHHIVITKDLAGGTMKLYIDTIEELSLTAGTSAQTGNPLIIGTYSNYPNYEYEGLLDQVRTFNAVLTATQIASLYAEDASTANTLDFPVGAGCQAAYTLDANSNNIMDVTTDVATCNFPTGAGCQALYQFEDNVTDTCANYDGTATDITYETGLFSKAAVFNGSTSRVVNSGLTSVTGNAARTYNVWGYTNGSTMGALMCTGEWGVGGRSIAMYIDQTYSPPRFKAYGYTASYDTDLGVLPTLSNGWHMFTLSWDGINQYKAYIDGVLISTTTKNATFNTTGYLCVGDWYDAGLGNYHWNSKIDQARLFDTVLTQAQITELARGAQYNGASSNVVYNGFLNFKPDLTWIKSRSFVENHAIFDSVRGVQEEINSNRTNAQSTKTNAISSFDSNGFTTGDNNGTNKNTETYAAWNWKAGADIYAGKFNGLTLVH